MEKYELDFNITSLEPGWILKDYPNLFKINLVYRPDIDYIFKIWGENVLLMSASKTPKPVLSLWLESSRLLE